MCPSMSSAYTKFPKIPKMCMPYNQILGTYIMSDCNTKQTYGIPTLTDGSFKKIEKITGLETVNKLTGHLHNNISSVQMVQRVKEL